MDSVRIDKYLWAGVQLKPSRTFKIGDTFNVRKGPITYTYKVLRPLENRVGAKLVPDFVEDLTPEEEKARLHAPVETFFVTRERGTGRPTKKERREMDQLWDSL